MERVIEILSPEVEKLIRSMRSSFTASVECLKTLST